MTDKRSAEDNAGLRAGGMRLAAKKISTIWIIFTGRKAVQRG
jgi:hypothetical protein